MSYSIVMTASSTGYGPSATVAGRWNRLYLDGDERKYVLLSGYSQ